MITKVGGFRDSLWGFTMGFGLKCANVCYERYSECQDMKNWPVMCHDHFKEMP